MNTVAVVGAGAAGLSAAAELRRRGWDGRLVIVGDEPERPYRRPPLSKEYLLADEPPAVHFPGASGLDAEWRLGTRATGLDLPGRAVVTGDGDRLEWDGLVLATGAATRLPAPLDHPGVRTLRTLADADRLKAALAAGGRALVVGAGLLGGELASTLTALGRPVTLVDRAPMPLLRTAGPAIGAWAARLHREHGVDYRPGTEVTALTGRDGTLTARLSDGTSVTAGLVVAALGAQPGTAWLDASGLALADGIVLDRDGLAAPGVTAAGDAARAPHRLLGGELVRTAHHANAVDQGIRAAKALLGLPAGPAAVPSFQTRLHGRRLHGVGFTGSRFAFRAVEQDARGLLGEYHREGRLVGAVATAPRHLPALARYRSILEETP